MSSIWDFDQDVRLNHDTNTISTISTIGTNGTINTIGRRNSDDAGSSRSFSLLGRFRGHPENQTYPRARSHEIISGMEWEPTHGCLLATAGVSKQVQIYSMATLSDTWEDASTREDPIRLYRLASKLTSLAWNPARPGVVAVGDYDGCVTEIDLETGHVLHEGDEHSGRRVWGVSYGRSGCMASASEDGTVAFWDRNSEWGERGVVARIKAPSGVTGRRAALTGVEVSRWNEHLVGLSSADSCAYVYDLRSPRSPLRTLRGHTRPVSYVKFYDQNTLMTAGIDSSLMSWDLTREHGSELDRRYAAHSNNKHFVGLSVLPEEGLLGCGSETGHVFCYERWGGVASCVDARRVGGRDAEEDKEDEEDEEDEEDKEDKEDKEDEEDNLGAEGGGCRGRACHDVDVFCGAVAWRPAHVSDGGGPVIAGALSDASISVCRLSVSTKEP